MARLLASVRGAVENHARPKLQSAPLTDALTGLATADPSGAKALWASWRPLLTKLIDTIEPADWLRLAESFPVGWVDTLFAEFGIDAPRHRYYGKGTPLENLLATIALAARGRTPTERTLAERQQARLPTYLQAYHPTDPLPRTVVHYLLLLAGAHAPPKNPLLPVVRSLRQKATASPGVVEEALRAYRDYFRALATNTSLGDGSISTEADVLLAVWEDELDEHWDESLLVGTVFSSLEAMASAAFEEALSR